MAGIQISISKGGGAEAEVRFRFSATQTIKPFFSTGIHIIREYWSPKTQKLSTSIKQVPDDDQRERNAKINKRITNLKAHLLEAYTAQGGLNGRSSEELKLWLLEETNNFLHPKKSELKKKKNKTLMQIVHEFCLDGKEGRLLNDNGERLKPSSVRVYAQVEGWLKKFCKHSSVADYETDELNERWYAAFVKFLYDQGLRKNSVGKHIKSLKTVLRKRIDDPEQAAKCAFIVRGKCKVLHERVKNVYLDENKLHVMANARLNGYMDRVRDQFLLLCWTGQRYSDLGQLIPDNIDTTDDGKHRFFKVKQTKTGALVYIPVLPEVEPLLEKYKDGFPAPISNQKFNNFIKDVCKTISETDDGQDAGFGETVELERTLNAEKTTLSEKFYNLVTSHSGRRSFATNMFERNWPTQIIMGITGHETEEVFRIYIEKDPEELRKHQIESFFKFFDNGQQ